MSIYSFGDAVRGLRQAAGLSLAALAARVHYGKAALGHIETGIRTPAPELVAALDEALGSAPLLALLAGLEEGADPMRRRTAFAAVGFGLVGGPTVVSELVRQALWQGTGPTDWDEVVAGFEGQLVLAPTAEAFGTQVLGHLVAARELMDTDPQAARAAARLSLVYGLYQANTVDALPAAQGWYRTAAALAGRSGYAETVGYVTARIASRGPYDGLSVRQTQASIQQALATAGPTTESAFEAHAAAVHLAALGGDLRTGRIHVAAMRRLGEQLAELDRAPSYTQRAALFDAFLECRLADLAGAQRSATAATALMGDVPLWRGEVDTYLARAMVRHGAVTEGAALAMRSVSQAPPGYRWIAVAVSDLLGAVPADQRQLPEVLALTPHGYRRPGPWQAVAP